jgi:hypothetical protein
MKNTKREARKRKKLGKKEFKLKAKVDRAFKMIVSPLVAEYLNKFITEENRKSLEEII